MRTSSVYVLVAGLCLCLGLGGCGESTPPSPPSGQKPLWELTGLENPESALLIGDTIYVSNVAGNATDKDGNGFISKVSRDGKMIAQKWATGLDGPKGLATAGGKLYAADIDNVVEIDLADGKILNRYPAADAKFLNDAAADAAGNIYISDMATNVIWRLSGGTLEKWLESPALLNPNGLHVDGDKLYVAAWGVMTDGFKTEVPGHLLEVSIADKSVKALGDGKPVGNLDGLEPLDADRFLVTDWMAGNVLTISRAGEAKVLMNLGQGAADLGYDPATKTAFIPQMMESKLKAYKIE